MDLLGGEAFWDLLPFAAIGFGAQLVDGALGMAFGVIGNTLLVAVMGVAPARASANLHVVETFTTALSGISHLVAGNVDRRLFVRLLLPGLVGAVAGAHVLSSLAGAAVRPFVLAYLIAVGVYLLVRGLLYPPEIRRARVVAPLGLVGGFLDAAGGGGWGPVVTSNLLVQGVEPRRVMGTVNAIEFFVTLAASVTFILELGPRDFGLATIGLLIGGLLAAPFGAVLARRIPVRLALGLVGAVLIAASTFGFIRAVL